MKLLPVEDALARMLAPLRTLPGESIALSAALGRVLAEPVIAARDQPPFDASAMDGWAVRRADALNAAADLAIVGESAAGRGFDGRLEPGQAVRIFTGAAVPEGADMVVIQEDAAALGGKVRLGPLANAGGHIRGRGGDLRAGATLLSTGQRLDAWRLSLAAAAGHGQVLVTRKPIVAVLCTGEELVRPPQHPGPFQIYESGSLALCALIEGWGGAALRLEPARDTEEAIVAALDGLQADLVVTVGGASVGDYDVVKPALGQLGLDISVASVRLRPGKPTWFGVLGDGRPVLGLPGNPASALVCAQLFLRPMVQTLQGTPTAAPWRRAQLLSPLPGNGGREHLMRARLSWTPTGVLTVSPFPDQDSSLVTVFALADALLRRPADARPAQAGEAVDVLPLERL